MIDRSFGSIYFLPCSNSLLGIATSHIGLIRSLYCSVFKEPSLFKRLDYLTTFEEVCQMIFFEIFFVALSNGAASSATGIILPYCLLCVNCFFLCFWKWLLVCQTYVTPCLMKSWSVSFGDFHPSGRIGKQL